MENPKFEQRMALFARKHGLHLTWQDVKFGYRRARFICESREEMTAILNLLWHTRGSGPTTGVALRESSRGTSMPWIGKTGKDLSGNREKEWKRLEDWWLRYHLADAETRRLMACGRLNKRGLW